MDELIRLVRERLDALPPHDRAAAVEAFVAAGAAQSRPEEAVEREARAEAETAQRRIAFLYQATSTLFAGPLDRDSRLRTLANVVVPDLADWSVIDLVAAPDCYQRFAVTHWRPGAGPTSAEPNRRFKLSPTAASGVARVIATGKSELVSETSPASNSALAGCEDQLLVDLAARSYLIVPIREGTQPPVGALTLAFVESNRRYGSDDLAMVEDLSRRAALALENARFYQAAQHAVRVREDLLAIVSHDLRSPLSAVAMAATLLLRAQATTDIARIHKYGETIQRSANRMDILIRDLLSFASIEAGHLVVELKPTPTDEILREAVESAQSAALAKQVRITVANSCSGISVNADKERLLQVFSNLIGNAIKFSTGGSEIRVSADGDRANVRFAVADSGPGIPAEARSRIFERFVQMEETARQGTGLGLFIAKGIVDAHRGHIWVESEVGRGSAFLFTIPTV